MDIWRFILVTLSTSNLTRDLSTFKIAVFQNEQMQTKAYLCTIVKRCKLLTRYLQAVWSDWAIFESSFWQILLQKLPKTFDDFWAISKTLRLSVKMLCLLFGNLRATLLFIQTYGHTVTAASDDCLSHFEPSI